MIPVVYSRASWHPAHGIGLPREVRTAGRVVIHHAYEPNLPASTAAEQVAAALRSIEAYQAKTHTPTRPRISYGHLVDQAGRGWEGLGFGRIGAHAKGVNSTSEAICFLIDATEVEPSAAAMEAARAIIRAGVELGWISPTYKVSGHRDHTFGRTCPGDRLHARLGELAHDVVLAPPPPPIRDVPWPRLGEAVPPWSD